MQCFNGRLCSVYSEIMQCLFRDYAVFLLEIMQRAEWRLFRVLIRDYAVFNKDYDVFEYRYSIVLIGH